MEKFIVVIVCFTTIICLNGKICLDRTGGTGFKMKKETKYLLPNGKKIPINHNEPLNKIPKQQVDDIRKRGERILIKWIKQLNEKEFNEVFFYVGNMNTIQKYNTIV